MEDALRTLIEELETLAVWKSRDDDWHSDDDRREEIIQTLLVAIGSYDPLLPGMAQRIKDAEELDF